MSLLTRIKITVSISVLLSLTALMFAYGVASACGGFEEPKECSEEWEWEFGYCGSAEVEVEGPNTQQENDEAAVRIHNTNDHVVTIAEDSTTNESILKRTGVNCKGSLGKTATCSTRKLLCKKAGTATWSVHINPGNVLRSVTVKCDMVG